MNHLQMLLNSPFIRAAVATLRTLVVLDPQMYGFDVDLKLPLSSKIFSTGVAGDAWFGLVDLSHVLFQSSLGGSDELAPGAIKLLKNS